MFSIIRARHFLVCVYFLTPKFDLFFFPGIVTGIRIQDICCLIGLILCLRLKLLTLKIRTRIVILMSLGLITNVFSSVYFGTIFTSVLGVMRIFEYIVIAILLHSSEPVRILVILLKAQAFISGLQYVKILPSIDPGRGFVWSGEYSGTFGNAAELSYFIGASCFYLAISGRLSLSNIFAFVPLLNGVRAYILTFFLNTVMVRIRLNLGLGLIIIVSVLLFVIPVGQYFESLRMFSVAVWTLAENTEPTLAALKLSGESKLADLALQHRVGKWAAAISFLVNTPAAIFGVGLYSLGGALDGGILRIITEMGLVFSAYFIYILTRTKLLFLFLFITINLLFDAYLSSVVCPILIAIYLKLSRN